MKFKQIICSILLIPGLAGNGGAGAASKKLSALADTLISDYSAKPGVGKASLAVFPLNCEKKLEDLRIGFAASELMAHRFVASAVFTVVERAELGKLIAEQKLQASGIIDSNTAVRLGKVLGAGVILVGNIQKVGDQYQVNARLVNAETGAVLVSGYEELDKDAFEEDARAYLNLVPEKQTLGIYALYNYRENTNNGSSYVHTGADFTDTRKQVSFASPMAGAGLLFRPGKNIQINAEASALVGKPQYVKSTLISGIYNLDHGRIKLTTISVMAGYISRLSAMWNYYAGLGLQQIRIIPIGEDTKNPSLLGLLVKTGVEFKPQERIGIGLNLKYDLRKEAVYSKVDGSKLVELSPLSMESNLTLYF